MKNFIAICFSLLILINCSCSNNDIKNQNSGIYVPGFAESAEKAKNIYVGEIVSINQNPKVGFSYDTYYNSKYEQTVNIEVCEFTVKIIEVLKGNYLNTEINDMIPDSYRTFLNVGDEYIFCAGINYGKPDEIGALHYFNPYDAVKLNYDNTITIFNWKKYEKYKNNGQNRVESPPKNYDEIKGIMNHLNQSVSTFSSNFTNPWIKKLMC